MTPKNDYTIRPIRPDDIPVLLDLSRDMHKESGYASFSYNPVKMQMVFGMTITRSDRFGIVVEDSAGIHGYMVAMISEIWFSNDLIANDLMVYIVPGRRGGAISRKMIKLYEEWAISKNAKRISIGITTEINTDKIAKYYERLGYKKIGYFFKKGD